MEPLWIAVIGAVASILGAVIVNRYTAQSARAAQRQATEIERTKVDAEAYTRARENYDAALAEQERRIQRLQKELDEDRGEHRADMTDCKSRIRELEQARRADQIRLRDLAIYVRQLIAILRTHEIPFPEPPPEWDMT